VGVAKKGAMMRRSLLLTAIALTVAVSVTACATDMTAEERESRFQISILIVTFGVGGVIWILGNEVSRKLEDIRKTLKDISDELSRK